ncbi:MAG: OmpA family protein [Hyphomicrobiaceae bacterium]
MRSFVFVVILLIASMAVVPNVNRWPQQLAVGDLLRLEQLANAIWSKPKSEKETGGSATRARRSPDRSPPLALRHADKRAKHWDDGNRGRADESRRGSPRQGRNESPRRNSPAERHRQTVKVNSKENSNRNHLDPPGGESRTAMSDGLFKDSPFDVVRISTTRPSVFAGTTESNVQVSVLAGKRVIGVTESDRLGRWVLVTDRNIKDPNARFRVELAPKVASAFGPRSTFTAVLSNQERKQSVSEVKTRQLAKLKRLVEEAAASGRRNAIDAIDEAEAKDARSRGDADRSVGSSVGSSAGRSDEEPNLSASMPIPIQFAFRQAVFTPSGLDAADLLADYLIAKKLKRAILTGHADERGSEKLNRSLSRDRLYAVRRHLRKRGFEGTLVLLPRGEAEPFDGIERSHYTDVELYKLDRRVELKLE